MPKCYVSISILLTSHTLDWETEKERKKKLPIEKFVWKVSRSMLFVVDKIKGMIKDEIKRMKWQWKRDRNITRAYHPHKPGEEKKLFIQFCFIHTQKIIECFLSIFIEKVFFFFSFSWIVDAFYWFTHRFFFLEKGKKKLMMTPMENSRNNKTT